MLVKDLINELQKCNQNASVVFYEEGYPEPDMLIGVNASNFDDCALPEDQVPTQVSQADFIILSYQ